MRRSPKTHKNRQQKKQVTARRKQPSKGGDWLYGRHAVMAALGSRGLFFLDSVTAPDSAGVSTARAAGVPVLTRDVFLDNEDTPEEVRYRLEQVEKIALRTGAAIAIGHPHDATITVLRDWIPEAIARGFAIVPVSALVRRRYPALWEQAGRS